MVDLIIGKAIVFDEGTMGSDYALQDIPEDMVDLCETMRLELLEAVAEEDEALMEKYLGGEELSPEELRAAIHKATVKLSITPVLCGTAFRNKGVQPLLDAVVDYLPAPDEVVPMKGVNADTGEEVLCPCDDSKPLAALAFKLATDPYIGHLTFLRIYSGFVESGMTVYNATTGKKERIGRLLKMHANKREDIKWSGAGDIVAAVGLKDSGTGHSFCAVGNPVVLESLDIPEPVIEVAIEPKSKGDRDSLSSALNKLAKEDPSFRVKTDEESNQTPYRGHGRAAP